MSAALSLLLAGTLLTAAVAKLRDPAAFATTLAALRPSPPNRATASRDGRSVPTASADRRKAAVDRRGSPLAAVGPRGSVVGARAVPAVEAALAVALLAGGGRPAALVAAALLLLFTGLLRVLERRAIPCHCFGITPSGSGLPRNAALLVLTATLIAAPADALWTVDLTELLGAATAALGAACAWSLARALA